MEIDLSRLPHAVRQRMDEIFRSDYDLKILKAIERQTQTAVVRRDAVRWHADLKPAHEIDPVIDAFWRRYYGHNYTENHDLMRFLAKRNPEIVSHARAPKTKVGYVGPVRRSRRVNFARGTLQLAK